MTLSKRSSLLAFAIATATLTVPLSAREPLDRAVMQAQGGEDNLAGTWTTRIQLRNCQTGEIGPVPPSLTRSFGLFTFHRGGTASEYGIGPGQTPATRSPGHGVWRREHGWNQYSYSFTFTRYDATGLFVGSSRVRSALVLDAGDNAF